MDDDGNDDGTDNADSALNHDNDDNDDDDDGRKTQHLCRGEEKGKERRNKKKKENKERPFTSFVYICSRSLLVVELHWEFRAFVEFNRDDNDEKCSFLSSLESCVIMAELAVVVVAGAVDAPV